MHRDFGLTHYTLYLNNLYLIFRRFSILFINLVGVNEVLQINRLMLV